MGKSSIKRSILAGMLSIALLLYLLFTAASWMAGSRVMDGVQSLRYNASLEKMLSALRQTSHDKTLAIARYAVGGTDIGQQLSDLDSSMQQQADAILEAMSEMKDAAGSQASDEAAVLLQKIMTAEQALSNSFSTRMVQAVGVDRFLKVKTAETAWRDGTHVLESTLGSRMVLALDPMPAFTEELSRTLSKMARIAETAGNDASNLRDDIAIAQNAVNDSQAAFGEWRRESRAIGEQMAGYLAQAASATTLPAFSMEPLPAYREPEQVEVAAAQLSVADASHKKAMASLVLLGASLEKISVCKCKEKS